VPLLFYERRAISRRHDSRHASLARHRAFAWRSSSEAGGQGHRGQGRAPSRLWGPSKATGSRYADLIG